MNKFRSFHESKQRKRQNKCERDKTLNVSARKNWERVYFTTGFGLGLVSRLYFSGQQSLAQTKRCVDVAPVSSVQHKHLGPRLL